MLAVTTGGEGSQDFYKVTLEDVLISSYKASGGATLRDSFKLDYAKIVIEYKQQKADGSLDAPVKAGWDIKANKKI